MIYFTSDLHLGHNGILRLQERPFSDVQEMNISLIQNYNSVVRGNDTVFILGDVCHKLSVPEANELIEKLNGKKILIRGNHDKGYNPNLFDHITDFETISHEGHYIALMHYPMLSWPKSRKGSIQLHGHIHERMEYNLENRAAGIRRYDVGVDANNYYPVSVDQIFRFFGI